MILPFNVSGLPDTPEAKALKRLENLFNRSSIGVPLGIGTATTTPRMITIGGTFAGSTEAIGIGYTGTLNPPGGGSGQGSGHGIASELTFQRAASGLHAVVSGAWIRRPTITGGAATIGTVATLYVNGQPTEGGNNYGLFVELANSRLYGRVEMGRGGVGLLGDKDVHIWVTADSSLTDPKGSVLMTAEDTVGRTLAHMFSFAGGWRSAGIGAEQKDTTEGSADLFFLTRTDAPGGGTFIRWRITKDGHYVPESHVLDIGTTTFAPRTIHYEGTVKRFGVQMLGAQSTARADTSGASLAALEAEVNYLKSVNRDQGFMAT